MPMTDPVDNPPARPAEPAKTSPNAIAARFATPVETTQRVNGDVQSDTAFVEPPTVEKDARPTGHPEPPRDA